MKRQLRRHRLIVTVTFSKPMPEAEVIKILDDEFVGGAPYTGICSSSVKPFLSIPRVPKDPGKQ